MFKVGIEIKRSLLHDKYGGSRQSGISTCKNHPYIFIFTGTSGEQYGYSDGWVNPDVFVYTGEGQIGDMQFTRGNLKLRDHQKIGMRVFLFEITRKAHVRFIDELSYLETGLFNAQDRNDNNREVIKFFFKRASSSLTYDLPTETSIPAVEENNKLDMDYKIPSTTEREGLVTSRVGQGAYRKGLIHRWENQCAVTGYNDKRLLIASHIVPWRDSEPHERVDLNNGVLLSPTYDALFDRNLISFGDDGEIILSKQLNSTSIDRLGVTGKEKIIGLNNQNLEYMERHRLLILT